MLFECRSTSRVGKHPRTAIGTSLGTLKLRAMLGAQELDGSNADAAFAGDGNGHLWRWSNGSVLAELLICRPRFSLPEHMQVDDCWAALYRAEVTREVSDAVFSCVWEPGYSWIDGNYEGGEGQLGWAYDDGISVVSVSTDDELFLSYRAERDDWLPRRLLPIFDYHSPRFDPETVELSARGIDVRLPTLLPGDRVRIQFTVAWGTLDPDVPATWFAVDRRPHEILDGAGCD